MTVALPDPRDEAVLPESFTLLVSSDPDERGRIASALDGMGIVVMVPNTHAAVEVLQRADDAARAPATSALELATHLVRLTDLVVDRSRALVLWRDLPIVVSHLELEVLFCLTGTPGLVWTYADLHEKAWGNHYLGDRDSLHSLVKRLRRKLSTAGVGVELVAVRGIGFQLVDLQVPEVSRRGWGSASPPV
jgi:DNA-binding winged helix-turn-helix (wHTH) protein